uniref:ATP-dependent RNA helicase n=1 Tax=Sinocyclocheilus rhinocerous TaxID=307959 RepID=A0A673HDG1_9TELE
MALFMINRYLGEEEDSESSRESRSRALLAKLQEQVKARERQNASNRADEDEDQQQGDKEQKKRKREEPETEGVQRKTKKGESERKTDLTDEVASLAKKKKKQKTLSTENESANTGDKESDNEKSVEITETSERGLEESKKTEESVDPQISQEPKAENGSSQTTFHILGGFEEKTVQKVKRVLPQWLAQPDVIQRDIKNNLIPISEVPGICPTLLKKLQTNGIQNFFPVQAEVIPAILESVSSGLLLGPGGYRPRDICVSAPTGSGKTLAFVIPVVQIIDEADRMIDGMHQSWLTQVTKAVYRSPADTQTSVFRRILPGPITVASLSPPQIPLQKLLFSATLTHNPEKLQLLDLHQPRLFTSTHSRTETSTQSLDAFNFPQGLAEYHVPCTLSKKPLIILHFLLRLKFSPALCFTNSREAAHR